MTLEMILRIHDFLQLFHTNSMAAVLLSAFLQQSGCQESWREMFCLSSEFRDVLHRTLQ
jgi:hypothetical protein